MNRYSRRWLRAFIPMLLAGCNSLIESETRFVANARVTVTGTSPVGMLLITSNNFTATRNDDGSLNVSWIKADTQTITLPFDKTFPFGQTDRFVVKLVNGDRESTATVDMRVFLDGEEKYRQPATMKDSSLEFVFYQPIPL